MRRSVAIRDTPAESCDTFVSTDLVRSTVRSKLSTPVGGVEQPIRALSGARDRNRDSVPLGLRLRAPVISKSSRARQLLRSVRKPLLARQKRSQHLILNRLKACAKVNLSPFSQ